jgi:hypothetical protein
MIDIAWMALLAFFTAFSKELRDYANGDDDTFLMFFSEILLNGVCGIIVGTMTLSFIKNIPFVLACSAVGGLFGMTAVKAMFKIALIAKNIDISDIDLDDPESGLKKPVKKTPTKKNKRR